MGVTTTDYDIAIIGMGPVGCLAATLFSHAGLRVAAIERESEVYKLPRAVNLDGEIVRALQPLGLAHALDALLQSVRPGDRVGFANSKREFLFGQESKAFGANGWQPMNMFDQPEVERFLRDTALSQELVADYVGYTASDFEQATHGVQIKLQRNETSKSLTAGYLVACDGAASMTRKTLGIGWQDLGYDHDWLVVDVVTKPGHTLENTTLQVCDPDRISTYVCTKDPYRRWEFKLNEGETWDEMLEPANIRSLIDPWTPPGTYDIRRAAMYQFHAATAESWQRGRILLAGDAAHQTPPFLGQGMNTGMRDVINLAWKLPMIIRGLADQQLLTTYQVERDAHAHDLVDWAVSIGQLMDHLASVEAAQRAGGPVPPTPQHLQQSGYGQGRDQPPLRDGVVVADQVTDTGCTGFLFSQPIVTNDQLETRLDDLLGPNFAVIGKSKGDIELSTQSQATLRKLGAKVVVLDGLVEKKGRFDRVFKTASAVIVRPDRYLFGHTDGDRSLDDLISLLATKLFLKP